MKLSHKVIKVKKVILATPMVRSENKFIELYLRNRLGVKLKVSFNN
jgi:hypothetical protein